MSKQLTKEQIDRQDWVDGMVFRLVCNLAGFDPDLQTTIEWDMEWIAEIREIIQFVIVYELELMDEMEFYPYIELKRQE